MNELILNQIITTGDGSHTLFVPGLNEHYHSIHGAVQESEFIFLNCGFDYCKKDQISIFEAGFGTGLNALLTAIRCSGQQRQVRYTAIDKYPLGNEIISKLNYPAFTGNHSEEIFQAIHSSEWGKMHKVTCDFSLLKIEADLTAISLKGAFDLIYFDAFGPDKQPEMWSEEIIMKIASVTRTGGIFVTYSSKGEIKRKLRSAGFRVDLLPGPPGKRHIIRAIKI